MASSEHNSTWYKIVMINKTNKGDRIVMRADVESEALDLYCFMKREFNNKYNIEVFKKYGSN